MKTLSILLIAFALIQVNPAAAVTTGIAPAHRPEQDRQPNPTVRRQQFNLENGVALQGYDAVAYFTRNESNPGRANPGRAVKGSAANAFTYKNVTYHFASPANRKAFQENPDKYEPQYGGWCAYAMGATGEKVEIDPETFKIKDGKLFLFYHTFINNTLNKWNKDEPGLHKKADASWMKFVGSAS